MEAIRSTEPRDAMALYEQSAKQNAQAQVEQAPAQRRREDTAEISDQARAMAAADRDHDGDGA